MEDLIEKSYWDFDAEKKRGALSERDVFKKQARRLVRAMANEIEDGKG